MSVYIDDARIPFGRMLMSHMIADDLEELHAMARRVGLKLSWFQDKNIPHYDLCLSKVELAVRYGAKRVTQKQLVEIARGRVANQPELFTK